MTLLIPRDYQEFAVSELFRYFAGAIGNPIVVMPTGTGKSIVIARFSQRALQEYPQTTILCLTHVKELIEQNAKKLAQVWPGAPVGIYSAGLKRKDAWRPIMFGGVKSVFNNIAAFGRVDLLLIDECHLLSPEAETVYQQVIKYLLAVNPHMKIVGFTATEYRQRQGSLINKPTDYVENATALFTDIAVDMTSPEWWRWFIARNYLVQPISRSTQTRFKLANVGMSGGDFNQAAMQREVDKADLNMRVCQEALAIGSNRRRMLAFCSGVEHSDHIAECFTRLGWPVLSVHSKLDPDERDKRIAMLKAGAIWGVTNNNILTTGFDDPEVDYLPMLRATTSTSLWVQMVGRGTRPYEGKYNCLVPDFAGNIERLGPVNDPKKPKQAGKGDGEAPVKICEQCGCYNHASVRVCAYCGAAFDMRPRIALHASEADIFRGDQPEYKNFSVQRVFFHAHTAKASGRASVRVSFHCGSKSFNEYFNFEGKPYQLHCAHQFWRRFVGDTMPKSNDEALELLRVSPINVPDQITVHINKEYPEVTGYIYK